MSLRHIQYASGVICADSETGSWMLAHGTGFPDFADPSVRPPNGALFWRTDYRAWFCYQSGAWTGVDAGPETFDKGGAILSPTAPLNVVVWQAPFACVVSRVSGYRVGGSGATVNARRNGTAAHLAADLSLTSAGSWIGTDTVQNISYAEGDSMEIMIVTAAGSPTQVTVLVELRRS